MKQYSKFCVLCNVFAVVGDSAFLQKIYKVRRREVSEQVRFQSRICAFDNTFWQTN